jgi:hypothetical protein
MGLGLLLLVAAGCTKDEPEPDDTSSSQDDTASGDDTENTGDTSFGESFDAESPSFVLSLDGVDFTASPGNWNNSGTTSTLSAQAEDSAGNGLSVTMMIGGPIRFAGTYPVTMLNYSSAPPSDAPTVWIANEPTGVTFTTLGFDENNGLFGTIDGAATLTNADGAAAVRAGSGAVRSWPKF